MFTKFSAIKISVDRSFLRYATATSPNWELPFGLSREVFKRVSRTFVFQYCESDRQHPLMCSQS